MYMQATTRAIAFRALSRQLSFGGGGGISQVLWFSGATIFICYDSMQLVDYGFVKQIKIFSRERKKKKLGIVNYISSSSYLTIRKFLLNTHNRTCTAKGGETPMLCLAGFAGDFLGLFPLGTFLCPHIRWFPLAINQLVRESERL
jgi:hypothetical protein